MDPAPLSALAWDQRDLAALLRLDPAGHGVWRNRVNDANRSGRGRIYGGQLLGQALVAAAAAAHGRAPSVLQALFLASAGTGAPVDYATTLLQDGKRFISCAVRASQGARTVLDAHASFHAPGDRGVEHLHRVADAPPPPESLPPAEDLERAAGRAKGSPIVVMSMKGALEMRLIDAERHLLVAAPENRVRFWIRVRHRLPDDPLVHAACLAYLSDWWLCLSVLTRHMPIVDALSRMNIASLNHSLWLHRAVRADEWLLVDTESPHAQSGRGLAVARYFDRDGALAATATQECLLTLKNP